jgi:hypothetical protein
MNINDIPFGNPTRDVVKYLHKECILDSLLEELKNHPYPENDSEKTKTEILELAMATDSVTNPEVVQKFSLYDTMTDKYFVNILEKQNINKLEVEETIKNIEEDILPLIVKLKYFYQRIRPLQISKILNINLIPFESLTSNTPSYPSGHTIQARVYAEVLGNKYPQFYKPLHELATDVMWSRLYMGVHFPSDCQFADYVSQVIINHPDFKKKYKL